ncbi:hypothetical protein UAW_01897 [Enterococcus haemoperoxidus ATCC BAA-382]|uniref:Lipoprotein n=1 Tax=Enterococcus haemoperoxidus ATCC BAA-382 TaxID=1158608 RepID=R2QJE8_9ENTE|nr:hypothetical protein [Enterococcus haemoperoxidus]EOH96732.1 hypothetical protein UAW_01897 [Enterococcus haemoperoxidus ATCC BAA-382]EOT60228.1 hypothetical protein I583_02863 [Enterococcus haemoperoxidus ATCC BAA-382]
MKNLKIISFFLLGSLILAACESSSNTSSPNKPIEKTTQTKQTENTQQATSEHSVDETSGLENLDVAMEKLKTGNITEISGSDFIVGEDIEPGRYIIQPKDRTTVQVRIYENDGSSLSYQLGKETKDLKAFKLDIGNRISLANKSDILAAELLNDNFSNLSKNEIAYVSGSDTVVGTDLASGTYTIKPIGDKKVRIRIYHNKENSQIYTLGEGKEELTSFKLNQGDKIKLAVKSDVLALTRTK